jgi:hypothetical protein
MVEEESGSKEWGLYSDHNQNLTPIPLCLLRTSIFTLFEKNSYFF